MYNKMGIYRSHGEYVQCKYEQEEKDKVDQNSKIYISMCSEIYGYKSSDEHLHHKYEQYFFLKMYL